MHDVLLGPDYGGKKGISTLRTLLTLWTRHDVAHVFCTNRYEMALYIAEFYASIGRTAMRDLRKSRVKGSGPKKPT